MHSSSTNWATRSNAFFALSLTRSLHYTTDIKAGFSYGAFGVGESWPDQPWTYNFRDLGRHDGLDTSGLKSQVNDIRRYRRDRGRRGELEWREGCRIMEAMWYSDYRLPSTEPLVSPALLPRFISDGQSKRAAGMRGRWAAG